VLSVLFLGPRVGWCSPQALCFVSLVIVSLQVSLPSVPIGARLHLLKRWGPWDPDGEARALCSMHVVVARSGVGAVFVSWYSSYSDTKVQVLAHNRDFSLTELSSSILSPLSRSLRVLPRHDWGVFLCGIMGGGDDGERSHRLWAHLPTLTPNREDTL